MANPKPVAHPTVEAVVAPNNPRVLIQGEITPDRMRLPTLEVLKIAREKPGQPITILLNSPGGDIDAGMSFCRIVEYEQVNIGEVVVQHSTDSAAVPILSLGMERIAFSSVLFQFHPIGQVLNGRFYDDNLERLAFLTKHEMKVYCEFIAKRIGGEPKAIEKLMRENAILDVKAAKRLGLITEIIRA